MSCHRVLVLVLLCSSALSSNEVLHIRPKGLRNYVPSKGAVREGKKRAYSTNQPKRRNFNDGDEQSSSLTYIKSVLQFLEESMAASSYGRGEVIGNALAELSIALRNKANISLLMKRSNSDRTPFLIANTLNSLLPHWLDHLVQYNHCLYADLINVAVDEKLNLSIIGEAMDILTSTETMNKCHWRLFRTLQLIFYKNWKTSLSLSHLKKYKFENYITRSPSRLLQLLANPLFYAIFSHRKAPQFFMKILANGSPEQIEKLFSLNIIPYDLTFPNVYNFRNFKSAPLPDVFNTMKHYENAIKFVPMMKTMHQTIYLDPELMREYTMSSGIKKEMMHSPAYYHFLRSKHEIWKNSHYTRRLQEMEHANEVALREEAERKQLDTSLANNPHSLGKESKQTECRPLFIQNRYNSFTMNALNPNQIQDACKSYNHCNDAEFTFWDIKYNRSVFATDVMQLMCPGEFSNIKENLSTFLQSVDQWVDSNAKFESYREDLYRSNPQLQVTDMLDYVRNYTIEEKSQFLKERNLSYFNCSHVNTFKRFPQFSHLLLQRTIYHQIYTEFFMCGYSLVDLLELNDYVPILEEKHLSLAKGIKLFATPTEDIHPLISHFLKESLTLINTF